MADIPDNWRQKSPISVGVDEVIYKDPESGKYSGPFLKLLALRDLFSEEAIESFLNPSIKSLHDPYLLPGMKRGVDRLIKAIKSGDKISIFAVASFKKPGCPSVPFLALRYLVRTAGQLSNRPIRLQQADEGFP